MSRLRKAPPLTQAVGRQRPQQESEQTMSIANQVIEKAHGKAKPFELLLLKNGSIVWSEKHQTHHLAWASGENWKLLNQENTYAIREAAQQGRAVDAPQAGA